MKLRAAAVLATIVIGNGCSGGGPSDPPGGGVTTGSLRGNVNDQSGAPVASATVALSGAATRTTNTGANGSYTFTNLPVGAYTVTVTPPTGYNLGTGTGTTTVTVVAGQQANATAIVLNRIQTTPPPLSVSVSMVDNSFTPASVEVRVGGTVTFTNNGGNPHNATGGGGIATGNLSPGQAAAPITMPNVGNFPYNCTIHAGMSGTIIVRANTP